MWIMMSKSCHKSNGCFNVKTFDDWKGLSFKDEIFFNNKKIMEENSIILKVDFLRISFKLKTCS
jgi:hypothetical protein